MNIHILLKSGVNLRWIIDYYSEKDKIKSRRILGCHGRRWYLVCTWDHICTCTGICMRMYICICICTFVCMFICISSVHDSFCRYQLSISNSFWLNDSNDSVTRRSLILGIFSHTHTDKHMYVYVYLYARLPSDWSIRLVRMVCFCEPSFCIWINVRKCGRLEWMNVQKECVALRTVLRGLSPFNGIFFVFGILCVLWW